MRSQKQGKYWNHIEIRSIIHFKKTSQSHVVPFLSEVCIVTPTFRFHRFNSWTLNQPILTWNIVPCSFACWTAPMDSLSVGPVQHLAVVGKSWWLLLMAKYCCFCCKPIYTQIFEGLNWQHQWNSSCMVSKLICLLRIHQGKPWTQEESQKLREILLRGYSKNICFIEISNYFSDYTSWILFCILLGVDFLLETIPSPKLT